MLSINLGSFCFSGQNIYSSIRNVVAQKDKAQYNQGPAELLKMCHSIYFMKLQSLEGRQYGKEEPQSVLKAI